MNATASDPTRRYWHVTNGLEVWSSDGDAPLAQCASNTLAHLIVDTHNAAVATDVIARRTLAALAAS